MLVFCVRQFRQAELTAEDEGVGRARPCWTQALEFSSLVGSCLEVNVVLALGPRFLHFGVLAAVIPCHTYRRAKARIETPYSFEGGPFHSDDL